MRFLALYVALPPLLAVAAIILGRYTWLAASKYAALGETSIVESTLILASETVARIERKIIAADNAVIAVVDPAAPESLDERWRTRATELSPSVRAVLLLDENQEVKGFSIRGDDRDRWAFLYLYRERMRPDLSLGTLEPGRLKHHHKSYGGQSYLLTTQAVEYEGRRFYVLLHHDTGYIVREDLADLFRASAVQAEYNVVDIETDRIVYGRALSHAGNYQVGIRFPTTLYGWRLQVAATRAVELGVQAKSQRIIEMVLIGSSFAVLFFGVISLLVAAHNERQLGNLKSEFIANVSHELKTPLSVVRMFGEMLLTNRVKSEEKRVQYLEIIVRESERLSSLIENVLDFSRLERGKREYEMHPTDVGVVVNKALENFRYRLEHEGVSVEVDVDEDLPTVAIDEQGVALALINLLDNALKYGQGSPVEVHVRSKGPWIEIAVRDHGPGIPNEDARRVFDRFYRVERDRSVRGSGIGLALVKAIAEAHGGRVRAENAEGGGALVAFSLSTRTEATKPHPRASIPPEAS